MYFVFIYENRIMKPVGIVLRKGKEDEEEQVTAMTSNYTILPRE
jgi:hypothetical protein